MKLVALLLSVLCINNSLSPMPTPSSNSAVEFTKIQVAPATPISAFIGVGGSRSQSMERDQSTSNLNVLPLPTLDIKSAAEQTSIPVAPAVQSSDERFQLIKRNRNLEEVTDQELADGIIVARGFWNRSSALEKQIRDSEQNLRKAFAENNSVAQAQSQNELVTHQAAFANWQTESREVYPPSVLYDEQEGREYARKIAGLCCVNKWCKTRIKYCKSTRGDFCAGVGIGCCVAGGVGFLLDRLNASYSGN